MTTRTGLRASARSRGPKTSVRKPHRVALILIIAAVAAASLAACTAKAKDSGRSREPAIVGAVTVNTNSLHANELKFGASPHLDRSIVLQPDVVLIGGGADSVRSVSADGLVWTIKGSAAHANELQVGKIMFATGFGMGRVLAVSDSGGDKMVVIGPVAITDLIRDANFATTAPIALDSFQAYTTPTQPGLLTTQAVTSLTPDVGSSHLLTLPTVNIIAHVAGAPSLPTPPPLPGAPPLGVLPGPTALPGASQVGSYSLTPRYTNNELSVSFGFDRNGVRVDGTLGIHLSTPKAEFVLKIAAGTISEASIQLHGAGGFGVRFAAAAPNGAAQGNVRHEQVVIPTTITIPLNVLGFPLTAQLGQAFKLATAFTANSAELSASGDYGFNGTIGFGLHNGKLGPFAPGGFTVNRSILKSTTGVSPGPSALELGYAMRLFFGVGALGFTTGVWFKLAFGIKVVASALPSLVNCRQATLDLDLAYGIGWNIPKVVAAVVNLFLRLFHATPIQSSGALEAPQLTIVHRSDTEPTGTACTAPN